MPRLTRLFGFATLALAAFSFSAQAENLRLEVRHRDADHREHKQIYTWKPQQTAAVICDMWDDHTCKGAARRVAEMAPRVNELVKKLREQGVLIIHAPSDTTKKFYAGTPQLALADAAPKVETAVPLERWCHLDPEREGKLPIDDTNGGCDCTPYCVRPKGPPWPWTRQIATIEIDESDAISESATAFYLMKQRGITNVIILGVHTNMCVLGRPFSIRQMVKQGQKVVLVRDLTDSMYDHRSPPFVDHFTGTRLVVEHIEKNWCPTITSNQILGGDPFRFSEDKR